jgi:hypothetical protein
MWPLAGGRAGNGGGSWVVAGLAGAGLRERVGWELDPTNCADV